LPLVEGIAVTLHWRRTTSAIARHTAHALEISVGSLKRSVKQALGWIGPVHILPYRGYGTLEQFYLKGRVLEDKQVGSPKEKDTRWNNLRAMYRRFSTDEIPYATVRAHHGGQTLVTQTDWEGYFEFHWQPNEPLDSDRLWHDVHLEVEIDDRVSRRQSTAAAVGQVMVPPRTSAFGVISDIDDTILETYATDLMRTIRVTLLNNARTRLPLPGVAAFYQALHRGPGSDMQNPLFYVSSSAWNLYDLLTDFLDLNEIPGGPILLQSLSLTNNKLVKSGHWHKLRKLSQIMSTYPELPFVLIGDSGQEDPILYRQAVLDFPGRIKAIYIRDIGRESRHPAIRAIIAELKDLGVDMLLVTDTLQAAQHAADHGLISSSRLSDIHKDRVRDTVERQPLEQAV
jgi:phosphatidate phosphatase APP1